MADERLKVVTRIKDFADQSACDLFFDWLKDLVQFLNLNKNSEQLALNIRNDYRKRITVSLNSRMVLGLSNVKQELELMLMVYEKDLLLIKDYRHLQNFENTKENTVCIAVPTSSIPNQAKQLKGLWLKCGKDYLPEATKSQYRKHHMPLLFDMALSQDLRNEIYTMAGQSNEPIKTQPEYFLKSEFELLEKFDGLDKDDKNQEHTSAYKVLSETYQKIEYWAKRIKEELFKDGSIDLRKRPTNQANRFSDYLWAKIYPNQDATQRKDLAYTVSITSEWEFHIKIDTVGLAEGDERRILYEKYRGEFHNSPIVNIFPAQDYLEMDWDDLIEDSVEAIKSLETDFAKLETILFGLPAKTTNPEKKNTYMSAPLNQILFGPPGTGKTYNSINKALEIIGDKIEGKTRKDIKSLFDTRVKEGRIVFTTFHQSMSYEDFIEGIKPEEPKKEGHPVNYKIKEGIFKIACAAAADNSYKAFNEANAKTIQYSFDDLYGAFIESIQRQLDDKSPVIFKTLKGREVEIKELNRNNSIIARARNSVMSSSAPLTKENLQKLYDKFKTVEEIKDLKQVQETVQITPRITEFYAIFSGLKQFEKTYKPDEQLIKENHEIEAFDIEKAVNNFNAGVYDEAIKQFGHKAAPVVLIIDEINRGNVSQIFGELISLIEEDKRMGKDEALEATLPYSKTQFSVPPNLYILGTMNTADRSVEALDTALRRRFCFEEIRPDYTLKELAFEYAGSNAGKILETINKRIEKLLDRDHQIGHSYFILKPGESAEAKFISTFYKNIIPLLQEYFFGDYGKIGLVLGEGFVRLREWDNDGDSFADFNPQSGSDYEDREVYEIIDYRNTLEKYVIKIKNAEKKEVDVEMSFEKAIRLLMKLPIA